jgi:hypothetical protein
MYAYLMRCAVVPYLEMLEHWVYHGMIADPYQEFMVKVDQDTTKRTLRDDFNARYWDVRYTIRTGPPAPLLPQHKQKHAFANNKHPQFPPSSASSSSRMGVAQDSDGGENLDPNSVSSAARPLDKNAATRAFVSGAMDNNDNNNNNSNPHVPFFLRRVSDAVLTTGKYLNVIRECGRWVSPPFADRITYHQEDYAYDRIVSQAHAWASKVLLEHLLGEQKLVARLRAIKHYFLLDQGDFFVHFMDVAQDELIKPANEISVVRLQGLLDMCVRVRDTAVDPYQEDLTCELSPYTLIQHVDAIHRFASAAGSPAAAGASGQGSGGTSMPSAAGPASAQHSSSARPLGVDTFTLDFRVRWPLSLVLSRQALTKYQLIFRHLFFCKVSIVGLALSGNGVVFPGCVSQVVFSLLRCRIVGWG